MSRKAKLTAALAALLIPLTAIAAPPTRSDVPAANPETSTTPATGLDSRVQELGELESALVLAQKHLELTSTEAAAKDAQQKLLGVKNGTNDIPELIGISGAGGHMQAEFVATNSIVRAGPGDWVTDEWRVATIGPDGVSMVRRGGRERHQIVFGHQPVSSSTLSGDMARYQGSSTSGQSTSVPVSMGLPGH